MTGSTLLTDRAGAVLTLTLNRPHRKNALDDPTLQLLQDGLLAAREDPAVRALVLTGAGGDFCSGADVGGTRREGHPVDRMRWLGDIAMLLTELPKPVIAKVRGVAVGAGCNLALAADFVVAAPDARFSQIFGRRGLSPDFGGTWLLPRTVGLLQAKRLALLAEIIDATEAHRLGMVTWVKQAAEIDPFVTDLADQLAAGPPVAMAQTKTMLNQASSQGLREALESETRAAAINLATDALAARQAFVDKVEPVFEGRWQAGPSVRPADRGDAR
ncbi:enoyl-CoA hydratase/isomerase family protein [Ornithinimicrobium cavernae]|uniref:enoyl-CoA hydratase/isomerase family protein n=1 Tax=Ornithinimicrobium cavernae TaxID=2666047 RepID=UPI000D69C380|nr:enoyl-CoA hydratase-related protein [Ornithinimicrobium cavernae]